MKIVSEIVKEGNIHAETHIPGNFRTMDTEVAITFTDRVGVLQHAANFYNINFISDQENRLPVGMIPGILAETTDMCYNNVQGPVELDQMINGIPSAS